jgi:bacteriocin-like protein
MAYDIEAVTKQPTRILGRLVAKEMTEDEMEQVAGGSESISGGNADDCDASAD